MATHPRPTPRPTPAPKRRAAEKRGQWGERRAAWFLWLRGWRILDRRIRTPVGEVDLIARKGGLIAFVEVKTRADPDALAHAIDERRLSRVAAAAELLMPRYATAGEDVRIDVVLVAPRALPLHIENAWMG